MSFPCTMCPMVYDKKHGLRIHWGKVHSHIPSVLREHCMQEAQRQHDRDCEAALQRAARTAHNRPVVFRRKTHTRSSNC